jgi:hypothetical protein
MVVTGNRYVIGNILLWRCAGSSLSVTSSLSMYWGSPERLTASAAAAKAPYPCFRDRRTGSALVWAALLIGGDRSDLADVWAPCMVPLVRVRVSNVSLGHQC